MAIFVVKTAIFVLKIEIPTKKCFQFFMGGRKIYHFNLRGTEQVKGWEPLD
jgi:hypothetical protein